MSTAADERVRAQRCKLTPAQAEALQVLVKVAESPGGGRVEASKRKSTLTPRAQRMPSSRDARMTANV